MGSLKVKLVTGYIPLASEKKKAVEIYKPLGDKLLEIAVPLRAFLGDTLEDCWLSHALQKDTITFPYDNPNHNTIPFHCVIHQKTEWLRRAAREDNYSFDVYVWIDYGIFHVRGVTEETILSFLEQVDDANIAIPGCIPRSAVIYPQFPCWRFCGGLLVCPTRFVEPLADAVEEEARRLIRETGAISWEVNTWAHVEQRDILPIRQYDSVTHDSRMFTNYLGGEST